MNRSIIFLATAIATLTCTVQGQDPQVQDAMSVPEFRQVLVDLGTYLDSHKNTNLRQQFEAAPDNVLQSILPVVSNPRLLQKSVRSLRENDASGAREGRHRPGTAAPLKFQPLVVYPGCSADQIIDTSSGAACTPAYPDPTNTAWQSLVNPLIPINAFSPTDFSSISSQQCSLTVESNLSVAASTLQGTVLAASSVCGAIPSPGGNACWVVNAVFSIAAATTFGLFSDCQEQDGNVNAAEVDAAFHNTVTIYDKLNAVDTDIDSNITSLNTHLTNVNTDVDSNITNLNTHLTSVNTDVDTKIASLDTHITNVDTHIQNEFATLTTLVTAVVGNLSSQLTAAQNKLDADAKQIMKLNLELQALQQVAPAILTCDGTSANPCPNVLNACPLGKCAWNSYGTIP